MKTIIYIILIFPFFFTGCSMKYKKAIKEINGNYQANREKIIKSRKDYFEGRINFAEIINLLEDIMINNEEFMIYLKKKYKF